MTLSWLLPLLTFSLLAILERLFQPSANGLSNSRVDHLLNLTGLAIQGSLIPLFGYLFATRVLAVHWPEYSGTLQIGWVGAFVLNFVVVDFLYYWEHRLFHRMSVLWALHECHHAAPIVNVWSTSRNSLPVNFLLVYLLLNPLLGFLCDQPEAFFAAAAVTASLDVWRHSRLPERFSSGWLRYLLVTPTYHHAHHSPEGQNVNFGANLILWDRLFGTARESYGYPGTYGVGSTTTGGSLRQFLFPW